MPSSISSSKQRAKDLWQFAFGLWACAAAITAGALLRPAAAYEADIVRHQDPPSDDFYLAHDRGGHIDHHVLFHGIDDRARAAMRAADVLFLGNSRLMFALDSRIMREHALLQNYYVLGFGHEEQDDFPLEIIRSSDLRPSVVVINADRFFASDQSDWAERVIDESDFDAWKVRVEGQAAHRVRRILHRLVPQYVDLRRGQREVVLYRSRQNGTWFVANDFGLGTAFIWPENDTTTPTPAALAAAAEFKHALEQRGARIVLCLIPGPGVSLHRAQQLAAHLSVPLIVPEAGEIRTIDGSHLSYESAVRVTASLIERLRPHLP
jgi:hypothetical protein